MKKMAISIIVVLLVMATVPAAAMTAEKVVENVFRSYEQQMANIEDAVIVTDVYTKYQKRAVIDGKTIFLTRTEIKVPGVGRIVNLFDGTHSWVYSPTSGEVVKEKSDIDSSEILFGLKDAKAQYVRKDKINGVDVHVVEMRDLATGMQLGAEEMDAVSALVWIDAKDWLIRKMEMKVDVEDQDADGAATIFMEDYRDFQGMKVPFVTRFTMLEGSLDMTPEEQQELREGIEEMKRELEQMSGIQRRMVGGMMEQQIKAMESMLEEDGMSFSFDVKEVKVNVGLSEDLFNGNLLGK